MVRNSSNTSSSEELYFEPPPNQFYPSPESDVSDGTRRRIYSRVTASKVGTRPSTAEAMPVQRRRQAKKPPTPPPSPPPSRIP